MKTIVMTSDYGNYLLPGFVIQWQKYCGLPVDIFGFTDPQIPFPPNVKFNSLGKFEDYPSEKWSNALLEAFETFKDEQVLILLEDYFLVRQVPLQMLSYAETLMRMQPDVIRFDLTSDRLYSGNIRDVGYVGSYDLIQSFDSEYQISLQAGIWNKSLLKSIISENMSPWDIEMQGTKTLKNHPEIKVYGTRQWPMRYQIMVRAGQLELDGGWMFPPRQLSQKDLEELQAYRLLEKK